MDFTFISVAGGFVAAAVVFSLDLRRRRLSVTRAAGWHPSSAADAVCTAATIGIVAGAVIALAPTTVSYGAVPLRSPLTLALVAGAAIFAFIWQEGRRQIQFQRPAGIVCGEWLILAGAVQLVESAAFGGSLGVPRVNVAWVPCLVAILGGAGLIAAIVPPFLKRYEGNRIVERYAEQGESVQPDYTPPTPECPHPERWRMLDSLSSELEVLDFLKSLVTTLKPQLIVETGTFLGYGTIKMAEGLKENGFGRIITIEYEPEIFAKAKQRIDASGLGQWIEYRKASSLETKIEGTIDLLFSDSELSIREAEVRRFLPQMEPRGLILMHDASSHYQVVRQGALRLEQEGLISVVLLPTPRGLVIAQKRDGRK